MTNQENSTPLPPLLTNADRPEDYDFLLTTDGSGYTDGFGGAAMALCGSKMFTGLKQMRALGYFGITVDRAEFEGLLLGLHTLLEDVLQARTSGEREVLALTYPDKLSILWISDRQSLVGSVTRNHDTGLPYYRRRSMADLWQRFEFYENFFRIEGRHMQRNTSDAHELCDRMASDSRTSIKEILEPVFPIFESIKCPSSFLPPTGISEPAI